LMHGAMKFANPVRRELGIRTVFNILGPLTNPAGARRQLLGVFDSRLTESLARVLLELGSERAMVVHGDGGLDEMSTFGKTFISELKDGKVISYEFHHSTVGIPPAALRDVVGGDAGFNAGIVRDILDGKKNHQRDITVLNAGAALYVAGQAQTIQDGVRLAEEAIDSQKAKRKLQALIEMTN
jgi:anthranilate phosphoribosyltransferase